MRNYLRLFALLVPLVSYVACSDHEKDVKTNKVPTSVKESLSEIYPDANYVEWELNHGYYVADFYYAEDRSEKEVWFEKDGTWKMSVSNITFNQLPTTVKDAFESGEYKDWFVDDVDLIERPTYATIYVLSCEKRGSETERELYYTSEGELYKTTPDRDTDYREFITQEYPK